MRITEVEALNLVVPTKVDKKPISLAYDEQLTKIVFDSYKSTLVRITTDDGLTGVGECLAKLTPRAISAIVEDAFRPILIGQDPLDVECIWEMMYASMRHRGHSKGFMIEAMSGVDIALFDLIGKALKLPVYKLLGGCFRNRLDAYASSLRLRDTETIVKEAVAYVEQGFGAIKMKLGRGPEEDIKRVAAVRDAIGYDIQLTVDANCAYDVATAINMGRELEKHQVYWFEEPIPPEDIDGYVRLSSSLDIAIAAGETEFTRYGFRDLIAKRAVDIVQPDICRAGGFSECKKIAAMASAYNMPYAPHTGGESAVGIAASIQLAAAIPNFLTYEYMRSDWSETHANPLRNSLTLEPVEKFVDGYIEVPDKPGLGIELNEEIVSKYRVNT
jgi:D-arabinonate dehydratase/D-galactarolactone cycloisomerase